MSNCIFLLVPFNTYRADSEDYINVAWASRMTKTTLNNSEQLLESPSKWETFVILTLQVPFLFIPVFRPIFVPCFYREQKLGFIQMTFVVPIETPWDTLGHNDTELE